MYILQLLFGFCSHLIGVNVKKRSQSVTRKWSFYLHVVKIARACWLLLLRAGKNSIFKLQADCIIFI